MQTFLPLAHMRFISHVAGRNAYHYISHLIEMVVIFADTGKRSGTRAGQIRASTEGAYKGIEEITVGALEISPPN